MTRSSATRRSRSQVVSSPERLFLTSFLSDDRNNELSLRDALAAAQVEHERVREAAIRVYELHQLQEAHRRIVDAERKEHERLKAEAEIVAQEKRLQDLQAQTISKPQPEPETPKQHPRPAKAEVPSAMKAATSSSTSKKTVTFAISPTQAQTSTDTADGSARRQGQVVELSQKNQLLEGSNQSANLNGASISSEPAASSPLAPAQAIPNQAKPLVSPSKQAVVDRYIQIHQELKKLRRTLQAQSKVAGSPLKGKLGTFRREIRVAIGQLTAGKGANAKPINKITAILQDALAGQVPSPPIEVNLFMLERRQPADGVQNNDDTLPSLFIYLVNICSKAVINQFINECGANPKAAEPIGVFTAHIFSHNAFQWRGKSFIDILMAKFRIVCPVLFGIRGDDRTEKGRLALGWRRDGSAWITEQSHNDRMTGLGAGFGSLSLRDFSRAAKQNPYPPTNYWTAMASIVNSPAGETSNTQYIVLRSMIEGHESRFFNFYGNAALAALRLALIEFPKKAPANAAAAGSLRALAEVLRNEEGLILG